MAINTVKASVVRLRGAGASRGVALALALPLTLTVAATGAQGDVGSGWRGTILCTTKTESGNRSLWVDEQGRLAELTLSAAVAPGQKIELEASPTLSSRRAYRAHTASTVRVLGRARKPLIVRTRLIEESYARYGFYWNGHPWGGCRVAFDDAAAVSIAKLILSGRRARLRLGLRTAKLVHLGPREAPLPASARVAKAKEDLEYLLTLIAGGKSIAACATVSIDMLLFHGGRRGCVMAFESAKFLYRERYAGAVVENVDLFKLAGRSYALGTIKRHVGSARALLVFEGGQYRYRGDFELSPIELW